MKYLLVLCLILSACGQSQPAQTARAVSSPLCSNSKLVSNNKPITGFGTNPTVFTMGTDCTFTLVDLNTTCYITGYLADNTQGNNTGNALFTMTYKSCPASNLVKATYNYVVTNSTIGVSP